MNELCAFFRLAWQAFLDDQQLAYGDLEIAMFKAGLAEWKNATEANPDKGIRIVVGEVMVLTDAGREALK